MRKRILIDGDSDSDVVDEAMAENLEMTAFVLKHRYFSRPKTYRNKGYDAEAAFQTWITDRRIAVFTHMSKSSSEFIYNMIKEYSGFVNPSFASPSRQRSVYFQLFVCLTKLTGNGDGGCIDRVAELFNLGHGTIMNYTYRCIRAINEHVGTYVVWPNAARRAELSSYADATYGFPGFIASCDGTLIGLRRAPVFLQYPET